jgi:vacuolar-type H+-ATPase subunit H
MTADKKMPDTSPSASPDQPGDLYSEEHQRELLRKIGLVEEELKKMLEEARMEGKKIIEEAKEKAGALIEEARKHISEDVDGFLLRGAGETDAEAERIISEGRRRAEAIKEGAADRIEKAALTIVERVLPAADGKKVSGTGHDEDRGVEGG